MELPKTILREFVYPDLIKFYRAGDGNLILTAHTMGTDKSIRQMLEDAGSRVVDIKPKTELTYTPSGVAL